MLGRLHSPDQVESRGRELEEVGISHFKVHPVSDPCLGGVFSRQSCLSGTDSESCPTARKQSGQVQQSAAVTAAHIQHLHAWAKVEEGDAVIQHLYLRRLGRFVAFRKQTV